MGYNWEGKQQLCYDLYIKQGMPLERIMEILRVQYDFAPSKRAFQTQFKRWDFPSKQNPAHRNEGLVSRVKDLWERNISQKDMLTILQAEGFDIKERELMRVRAKNRWLLRVPNGMRSAPDQDAEEGDGVSPGAGSGPGTGTGTGAGTNIDPALSAFDQVLLGAPDATMTPTDDRTTMITAPSSTSSGPTPQVLAKQQERRAQLQQVSDERWADRKRRRRTRGWAGLPADPPGPPRFPSETTLDESKAFLALDNEVYRQLRDRFQAICEERGILKKTVAGPQRWQDAKDQLIRESPALQAALWGSTVELESKKTALDVLCADVTKRMRTQDRRMTIADAKNVLGINPEQSRIIRHAFYQILKDDHFCSKIEAGLEHWQELKARWIQGSPLLIQILGPDPVPAGQHVDAMQDPVRAHKVRAVEVLARDVMKRLRDDQAKRDPSRKKSNPNGPGPGPATPSSTSGTSRTRRGGGGGGATSVPSAVSASQMPLVDAGQHGGTSTLQIDPTLLAAAQHPSLVMGGPHVASPFGPGSFVPQAPYVPAPAPPTALPVYFRLSPSSPIQQSIKLWLATLSAISVQELRQLAASKQPGPVDVRVDGVVRGDNNQEVLFPIDEDDELQAYLEHINGGKASFNVQFLHAYA
ncbi:MAG: hypothetical protein M1823_003899 [Watsoniomyces obsoletus]|nr:MAG: hypothetical protein M1823_003899 [Watsoniomyces obsoletus]